MNERDLIFEQYKLIKEAEEQSTMTVDVGGNKFWMLPNGELHRVDGPAVEYANGDKQWWVNDKRHREDGPAVELANGTKEWWVNDIQYNTPSDWAEAVLKLHNKPYDQKDIDRFLKLIFSNGLNDLL